MQSFPQPPSAKEEREYLKRCRAGDKDARNALIERNLRLVAYIAKKYASMDRDMEDLISIGTIGLIKAVDSFDESKGIRLASYASRCVENELLMNFRARKKTARDVYLYDTIGSDKEGNEIDMRQNFDDEETGFDMRDVAGSETVTNENELLNDYTIKDADAGFDDPSVLEDDNSGSAAPASDEVDF